MILVEVVKNPDLAFVSVCSVQPAGVLNEPPLERQRHRQKQGVEPWQVEAFAYQCGGRKKDIPPALRGPVVDFGTDRAPSFDAVTAREAECGHIFCALEAREDLFELV